MYADEDTPLFEMEITASITALWVCVQESCDGIHHYYVNVNSFAQEAA